MMVSIIFIHIFNHFFNRTDAAADDMRRAFIESDFAALFLRGIKSGANSSCLLAALNLLLNDGQFLLTVSYM